MLDRVRGPALVLRGRAVTVVEDRAICDGRGVDEEKEVDVEFGELTKSREVLFDALLLPVGDESPAVGVGGLVLFRDDSPGKLVNLGRM